VILYIAGYGRSGSTLLDRLLGLLPGVRGLGEIARLPWHLRDPHQAVCACGTTLAACPFWSRVVAAVDPALRDAGGPAGAWRLVRRYDGARRLWLPGGTSGRAFERYAGFTRAVLAAVRRETGVSVLVDSSKSARNSAARPLALAALGEDVRVVHLVRPLGGVLASVRRYDQRAPLLRAPRTVAGYAAANLAARTVGRRIGPGRFLPVRFEDLITDAEREVARIGAWAGLPLPPAWPDVTETFNHRFAGNRSRLEPLVIPGVRGSA
jgi:hypothetical protein